MEEDKTPTELTFRFVVNQLSKLKASVLSPPYYIRNFSWTIEVIPPNLLEDTTQRYLEAYLYCNSEASPWAYFVVGELRLLPVRPGVTPFTRKIQKLFYSEGTTGWGYRNFMPWTDVLNIENSYIKDDSITLEVHIVDGNTIHEQLPDLELDEERKQRTVAAEAHKKLEGDLKKAETQIEFLFKVTEDTLKQLKKSQQCKCNADETKAVLNELAASSKDEKRKEIALEAELLQLTEDLASSERGRRAIETKCEELQEEITNGNNKATLLENEKRRLETKIATLEKELEEEQSNNTVLSDKLRKTKLSDQRHQSSGLLLQFQNRELKAKLSESEGKITNSEEKFEAEVKERVTHQKQSRELLKKLKDLEMQLEDKMCQADQYKEQVEKANGRVKAVKRRLEEAEEENSREKAQKRKAQHELEDMVVSHKSMAGEISILNSLIRRNAECVDLSSCPLGTVKSSSLNPEENESEEACKTQDHALEAEDTTT